MKPSTILTFFAILAVSTSSVGAAQDGPAGRYLKGQHDEVTRLLRGQGGQAEAQISQMIGGLLDFQEVSRRALAQHWEGLTEAQRTEFAGLLQRLVQRNYQGNLERTLDYEIRYGGEESRAGAVVVSTTARSKNNRRAPEVSIEYTMVRSGNRWVVNDVTTDGVSMVRNYRNQFNRIIARDGFDALLARMQQRLDGSSDI